MKLALKFFEPSDLKLEMKPEVLTSLLETGHIHATDFRCLDFGSKQIVWKILLSLTKSKLANRSQQRTYALNQHESLLER